MSGNSEIANRKSGAETRNPIPDTRYPGQVRAFIFDVDGVLVDSPHFEAWGEALRTIAPEAEWTQDVYQAKVAGMPRFAGSAATLTHFGIADPDGSLARRLGDLKQQHFVALIERRAFEVYQDAVRLLVAAKARGLKVAAASSSKNAGRILDHIAVPGSPFPVPSLLAVFDANVCGIDLPKGKPAPDIFIAAASALAVPPAECVVVEDAVSGVQAAKAGGMKCIGVARHDDAELLRAAGADLVVSSLDDVPADWGA